MDNAYLGSPFSRSGAGQGPATSNRTNGHFGAMTSANVGYLPSAGPLRWRARTPITRTWRGRLYGLVIRLADRLPAAVTGWVHHVTEVGEYGLALDDMASILAHGQAAITDEERADMLALAGRMGLEAGRVPGLLEACPRAGEDHGTDST